PTPERAETFLNDPSEDAYDKLIDELLASPRYGERWGRHWLDVVRYGDTGGFGTGFYFKNAWHYRDYVIESFNKDKPYDRFVREQVAGDELWPDKGLETRLGTGLYTMSPLDSSGSNDDDYYRYTHWLEWVDTTSEAFLGLTFGCARCHDH